MSRFALTLLAGVVLGALAVGAVYSTGHLGGEVRVSVRALEDGRSEVAVQFRQADGSWSERALPQQRFVPADAEAGRWLNSSAVAAPDGAAEALRIGYLGDYSGPLAPFGPALERAARLAVAHLNSGGVLGREVEIVVGDTGNETDRAVAQARRMIEREGVDALVIALPTAQVRAVAETVGAPSDTPIISPTATSVELSASADDDYLFRTTISDAAQGPVLARLAADEGYGNAALLYIDDPYGRGLSQAFQAAWDGEAIAVGIEDGPDSYLAELQQAAAGGAEVLIAIAYPAEAEIFLREALEHDLFTRFLFVDATRSPELPAAVGAERLNGMKGTAPAAAPGSESLRLFNAAYEAAYGAAPAVAFARETYDAVIALGLAAASAGSTDGAQIRARLREVAGAGGTVVNAGPSGVAAGLAALAAGDAINYEGAAGSLDWDAVGDLPVGYIGIWRYAAGGIEDLSVERVELGGGR